MAPPTVASAMYLIEWRKIVVHESVCDCGSREER